MKNKLGWFIVIAWVAGILYLMSALAEAQVLNSDPAFMREGPKAYKCKSPKGRNVKCNKWLTVAKRGWRRSCVQPGQSVLRNLPDPFDAQILLGESNPSPHCVMLFDESWADYRRFDIKNKRKKERELTRELRPAEFHQFVEVKEEGTYELQACMARKALPLNPEYMSMSNQGGITVSLIEWHRGRKAMPTWHMMLPENKAAFGIGGTMLEAQHFDMIVDSPEQVPHYALIDPGAIVGVQPQQGHIEATAYVYDRDGGLNIYDGVGRHLYYADGYDGHAGLEHQYQGSISTKWANWSCHGGARYLLPGFYVLSAEIRPTWVSGPNDGPDVSEYFGFGAIRHIVFRKVQ